MISTRSTAARKAKRLRDAVRDIAALRPNALYHNLNRLALIPCGVMLAHPRKGNKA